MAFLPICREYLKVVFQRPQRVLLTHPPQSLALGYRITFRPLPVLDLSHLEFSSNYLDFSSALRFWQRLSQGPRREIQFAS